MKPKNQQRTLLDMGFKSQLKLNKNHAQKKQSRNQQSKKIELKQLPNNTLTQIYPPRYYINKIKN